MINRETENAVTGANDEIITLSVVERVPELCCVNGNVIENVRERVSSENEFARRIRESRDEAGGRW